MVFFFRVHDVSRGSCQSKFPTILKLLEIENANVANALIDLAKVERIIIIDREREAQDLLGSVQTAPRNLLYALTLDYNQYYPAPNYRSYAMNQNKRGVAKLQTSVAEHLESLNTQLEAFKAELEKVTTIVCTY